MNVYPYRWWCAVLLGLLLSVFAYFYVLNPQVDEWIDLQNKETNLVNELAVLKKNEIKAQHVNRVIKMSKTEWLTVLPTLAQLNGVVIRSIAIKPTPSFPGSTAESSSTLLSFRGLTAESREVKIKFAVEGSFAQLARFVLAMHEKAPNGLIENFSYQLTKQQTLLLTIDTLLITDHFTPSQKKIEKLTNFHNPFCLATNTVADVHEHPAAVSGLSLTQMKMAGSFSQGERQMALIMLPTGALAEIYLGDEIGLEKGVVMKINSKKIELILPSGKVSVLWME
jgi:hypothetical protein